MISKKSLQYFTNIFIFIYIYYTYYIIIYMHTLELSAYKDELKPLPKCFTELGG